MNNASTNEARLLPIFNYLKEQKDNENFVIDKTGVKTVESIVETLILNPMQPILKFPGRKTPENYAKDELAWYYSMDLSVDFIGKKAKIWNDIASNKKIVNSNYGWCLFSEDNYYQYANCFRELVKNPESRRAIMIYTRPSMHIDYCKDGMNDFICTNTVQCFIRNNELIYVIHQRSCDAIFGMFNDFYWHCHIYEKLLNDLKKVYSDLTYSIHGVKWLINSIHVYERHFDMLDCICKYEENEAV